MARRDRSDDRPVKTQVEGEQPSIWDRRTVQLPSSSSRRVGTASDTWPSGRVWPSRDDRPHTRHMAVARVGEGGGGAAWPIKPGPADQQDAGQDDQQAATPQPGPPVIARRTMRSKNASPAEPPGHRRPCSWLALPEDFQRTFGLCRPVRLVPVRASSPRAGSINGRLRCDRQTHTCNERPRWTFPGVQFRPSGTSASRLLRRTSRRFAWRFRSTNPS